MYNIIEICWFSKSVVICDRWLAYKSGQLQRCYCITNCKSTSCLYGCETWILTLKGNLDPRMLENRDGEGGGGGGLHDFSLLATYDYSGQVKENETGRACGTHGGRREI